MQESTKFIQSYSHFAKKKHTFLSSLFSISLSTTAIHMNAKSFYWYFIPAGKTRAVHERTNTERYLKKRIHAFFLFFFFASLWYDNVTLTKSKTRLRQEPSNSNYSLKVYFHTKLTLTETTACLESRQNIPQNVWKIVDSNNNYVICILWPKTGKNCWKKCSPWIFKCHQNILLLWFLLPAAAHKSFILSERKTHLETFTLSSLKRCGSVGVS